MQVTIGLSPGTRHIGIAVMHRGGLIAWRVQTFKGVWSAKKQVVVVAALEKLFAAYAVVAIKVKIPDAFPDSLAFSQLLGVINNLCERVGLRPDYYTLSDIKRQFSQNPKVNKEAVIAYLVHKYPELQPEYRKEQQKRTKYYIRLFEAVAVGLCVIDGV
jgi:Holliday junction resolvasome RuvABC endonuclease subunit